MALGSAHSVPAGQGLRGWGAGGGAPPQALPCSWCLGGGSRQGAAPTRVSEPCRAPGAPACSPPGHGEQAADKEAADKEARRGLLLSLCSLPQSPRPQVVGDSPGVTGSGPCTASPPPGQYLLGVLVKVSWWFWGLSPRWKPTWSGSDAGGAQEDFGGPGVWFQLLALRPPPEVLQARQ